MFFRAIYLRLVRLRVNLSSIVLTGVAIQFAAAAVFAQPNEKTDKANAVLNEGRKLADDDSEESWKAAVVNFEESYKLFIEAMPPDQRLMIIGQFAGALRNDGNRYVTTKRFSIGDRYLRFALEKVSAAGLRAETGYLIEDLANSAIFQKKGPAAAAQYKEALAIHVEVKNYDRVAYVYRQLGLISYDDGNYVQAIKDLSEALSVYRQIPNKEKTLLTLVDLGDAYFDNRDLKNAELNYRDALAFSIELKNTASTAEAKMGLGRVYYNQYRGEQAVRYFQDASEYYRLSKDVNSEALALLRLGKSFLIQAKKEEARSALTHSAAMLKGGSNPAVEGEALTHLGYLELTAGHAQDAKRNFESALLIFEPKKLETGIGLARIGLSEAYLYSNDHQKALENAMLAKSVFERNHDLSGLSGAYLEIGWIHASLSRYDEAIRNTTISLQYAERSGESRRQADALVNLGFSYSAVGLYQGAIEHYSKALDVAKRSNYGPTIAICLNNLGYNHFAIGDMTNAESYLRKAIVELRTLKMKREEGYALHNLGMVFYERKNYKEALEKYQEALRNYLETNDRRVQAYAYMSIGQALGVQKHWDQSLENLEKAILLAREVKYSDVEGNSLGIMMELWEARGSPRLAILYGKQAVNLFQNIRTENRGLEKNALAAYLKQNESTYRQLADLLAALGRLPEAQQVLDLLKAEEYLEFVRRDASEASEQAKLSLTETERKALEEYSRLSGQLTALGARFQTLQEAKNKTGGKLPEADEAEFQRLKVQIEEAGAGIRTFLFRLSAEFSKTVEDQAIITPYSIETLRADLRRAGPDVVLVSTYLLPERYRAIVTTGRTMVDRKVEYKDRKLTREDVNRKIAEFQRALQNPSVDPRPLGRELYDIFVKPLENDLRGAGAKTVLWSLDGSLRYIPIAALSPDGKTYLAEHYQNVIVTLARQTNLFTKPSLEEWRALGAGVSKPHEGFAALPSVIDEINSIVRESGTGGVLEGKKLIDEKFDLNAIRNSVPQQTADGKVFNVVHLATHFRLGVNDQDSALLLGDGKRLSLFEISKDESLDFKDVELLALSACETGISAGDGSGREVESLGMLAQKKGAKSVLATLWKVADESTSMFMTEFYRLKKANPQVSKSEAVRQTQKAMIDGKIKSKGKGGGCRADRFETAGKQSDFKCDPNAPFSHPYFWSPFVLIGNWR